MPTLTENIKATLVDLCDGDKNVDLRKEITIGTAEAMEAATREE